jgi:D-lactate dehydrogenase (cytochrome)
VGREAYTVSQVSTECVGIDPCANNDRFSGSEKAVEDNIRLAQDITKSNGCHAFESANTEDQMQSLWSARKQALWANLAVRPEGTQIWSTDVAVPLSRMAELIGKMTS